MQDQKVIRRLSVSLSFDEGTLQRRELLKVQEASDESSESDTDSEVTVEETLEPQP